MAWPRTNIAYTYVLLALLVCFAFLAFGIAALVYGTTLLQTPSQRPEIIAKYNSDAGAWTGSYRASFEKLNPSPAKYDTQVLPFHQQKDAADKLNDTPQSGEVIASDYAQLRLQTDNAQLLNGKWSPTETRNLVVNTGVEEKQFMVQLMVNQHNPLEGIGRPKDRPVECRTRGGFYNMADTNCVFFYKLARICILVNGTTGRFATLPGAQENGCGLKNPTLFLDKSFYYGVGEYELVTATDNANYPSTNPVSSTGPITVRDINDPFVQLGYRTKSSFNFGVSQSQKSALGITLVIAGVLLLALLALSLVLIPIVCCIAFKKASAGKQEPEYQQVANSQPLLQ